MILNTIFIFCILGCLGAGVFAAGAAGEIITSGCSHLDAIHDPTQVAFLQQVMRVTSSAVDLRPNPNKAHFTCQELLRGEITSLPDLVERDTSVSARFAKTYTMNFVAKGTMPDAVADYVINTGVCPGLYISMYVTVAAHVLGAFAIIWVIIEAVCHSDYYFDKEAARGKVVDGARIQNGDDGTLQTKGVLESGRVDSDLAEPVQKQILDVVVDGTICEPNGLDMTPAMVRELPSWYTQFTNVATQFSNSSAIKVWPGAENETVRTDAEQTNIKFVCFAAAIEAYAAQLNAVHSGDIVGICMARSSEFAALLIASSKLDAKSLPLPPEYPAERLESIMSKSGLTVTCVRDGDAPILKSNVGNLQPIITIPLLPVAARASSNLGVPKQVQQNSTKGGVVLSSSGTTGTPKLIERRESSFSHRLQFTWAKLPFHPSEESVQKSHMSTTHSLYELLEPLLCGATVHILPDVGISGVSAFWKLYKASGARRLLIVPSLLASSLDGENAALIPASLEVVTLMGEAPQKMACRKLRGLLPHVQILSIYGCTEASSALVVDVGKDVHVDGPIDLGTPIHPTVHMFILNDAMAPVRAGEIGTLYFSGSHLFTGYVGDAELTQEVFSSGPGDCSLFNTKDRVELRDDGGLRYIGRADDLVKVHGNRVQLGEVQGLLVESPDVTAACVMVDDETQGLAAFVSPDSVDVAKMRERLTARVPHYMVPRLLPLPELPATAQGKIDRGALKKTLATYHAVRAAIERGLGRPEAAGVPSGPKEDSASAGTSATVQRLVEEVTGVHPRANDRLRDLGLDSVSILAFAAKLRALYPGKVSDALLLRNPTVDDVVHSLQADQAEGGKAISINMNALNGFRFLVSLWIVRGHFEVYMPYLLQDTFGNDVNQNWRGKFFMLTSGLMMTMRYDRKRTDPGSMLKQSMLHLMPVYWLAMLVIAPLDYLPVWNHGDMSHLKVAIAFVSNAFLLNGFVDPHGDVLPCDTLGPTYYLRGQLLFTLCFNPIQTFIQAFLAHNTSKFSKYVLLAVASASGEGFLELCDLPYLSYLTFLPVFVVGVVMGQACLQIELDAVQEKIVAWTCDILAVLLFVQAASSAGYFYVGLPSCYSPWILCIAFLIFGCCRTRALFGRLLATPLLNFAELSYVIYIFHPVILAWFKFVSVHKLDSWGKVAAFDYAGAAVCSRFELVTMIPPFAHVSVFVVILFVGICLTTGFHNPCQRMINRKFLSTAT